MYFCVSDSYFSQYQKHVLSHMISTCQVHNNRRHPLLSESWVCRPLPPSLLPLTVAAIASSTTTTTVAALDLAVFGKIQTLKSSILVPTNFQQFLTRGFLKSSVWILGFIYRVITRFYPRITQMLTISRHGGASNIYPANIILSKLPNSSLCLYLLLPSLTYPYPSVPTLVSVLKCQ